MERIRKAIITGPTGAVGIALIEELTRRNIKVTAVCRPCSLRIDGIPHNTNVEVVECDLSELDRLPNVCAHDYDVFYHLGWTNTFGTDARNNMDAQVDNIRYTLAAARSAAKLGCQTFVGAGSQAEYGRSRGLLRPDTPCFPENGYGMAKLCAGEMSRVECQKLGIRHIWARILSVYGPGDGSGTLVSSMINTLLDGKKPLCTAGEQMWDYLYSEDAARALIEMAEAGKNGAVYPLGSGEVRPLKEYIDAIRNAVDPNLPVGLGEVPYAANQVMYLGADLTALQQDTGFQPQITFEEGIQKTIASVKKERKTEKKAKSDWLK